MAPAHQTKTISYHYPSLYYQFHRIQYFQYPNHLTLRKIMESILKERLEERRKKAQRRRKIRLFITV